MSTEMAHWAGLISPRLSWRHIPAAWANRLGGRWFLTNPRKRITSMRIHMSVCTSQKILQSCDARLQYSECARPFRIQNHIYRIHSAGLARIMLCCWVGNNRRPRLFWWTSTYEMKDLPTSVRLDTDSWNDSPILFYVQNKQTFLLLLLLFVQMNEDNRIEIG